MERNDDDVTDLDWLAARNQAWFDGKGKHSASYASYPEGRLYFYTRNEDAPDNPDAWYPGESIGTWSPRSKTFMWACDNETSTEQSTAISKKAKSWFESNGSPKTAVLPVESLQLVWKVVSIAARLSIVVAVYNMPLTYRIVSENLKKIGKRVPAYKRNKIYAYDFFAITGEKHVV